VTYFKGRHFIGGRYGYSFFPFGDSEGGEKAKILYATFIQSMSDGRGVEGNGNAFVGGNDNG
jgi:hypothetical protein